MLTTAALFAMAVSCKMFRPGASRLKSEQVDTVQVHKLQLEAGLAAALDSLSAAYTALGDAGIPFTAAGSNDFLTEKEKLMRPDYLLDPAVAEGLLTIQQKLAALAILGPERRVRMAYGMPVEESEKMLARLAADLNLPADNAACDNGADFSDRMAAMISYYREQGLLNYYWYFEEAILAEGMFLFSRNPEPFLRSLSDEDIAALSERMALCDRIAREYAEYEPSIADVMEIKDNMVPLVGTEEFESFEDYREYLRAFLEDNGEQYAALRIKFIGIQ